MPRLLSIRTVAQRCEVHETTVRRWLRAGLFPAPVLLPNGQPRWHSGELRKWLKERPKRQ